MSITERLALVRSALFLPSSNQRAIVKAQGLPCDMAILDLEDAVKDADKGAARDAALSAIQEDWQAELVAIRVNGIGTKWHVDDLTALAAATPDVIVVPKVEAAAQATAVADAVGSPVLAMIETPRGIYEARHIASARGVAGLIAGTNDLATALRLPPDAGRVGLALALQSIILAARAAGIVAFDGVYNRLDDPDGFEQACNEGSALGFDGKTLIHPSQVDICNTCFGPTGAQIAEARELIAAAHGGAERFKGRMVETMHVESALRLLERAR